MLSHPRREVAVAARDIAEKPATEVKAAVRQAKRVDPVETYRRLADRYPKVMAELAK